MFEPDTSLVAELLRQSLKEGYLPYAMVTSDSMAPLIRSGDEIQVASTDLEKLKAGDVLLLAPPDELLAHRFWRTLEKIEGSYLVTRGDRLSFFDPPYPDECLVGKVITRTRNGKVLSLKSERGRWLNEWITWLSGMEARLLGLTATDNVDLDISHIEFGKISDNQEKVVVRLVRRLLYWAALIPTRIIDTSIRP